MSCYFSLFQSLGRRTSLSRWTAISSRRAPATSVSSASRPSATRATSSSTWRWTTCRGSRATPAPSAAPCSPPGGSWPRTSPNNAHSLRRADAAERMPVPGAGWGEGTPPFPPEKKYPGAAPDPFSTSYPVPANKQSSRTFRCPRLTASQCLLCSVKDC